MKLAAILACRNQSSRLYAKPLQNLDVDEGVTILDYLVAQLKQAGEISDVVLAISENPENGVYVDVAERLGLPYVMGDDRDVLARLIKGARLVGADHVFRVTSESPYPYLSDLADNWAAHLAAGADYTGTTGLPDGSYYELISLSALERSWVEGEERHRSELCTLFINENVDSFTVQTREVPEALRRSDVRLTVDWPEDLIVMREVYEGVGLNPGTSLSLLDVIEYLDEHPKLNAVNSWIDSGQGRIWF